MSLNAPEVDRIVDRFGKANIFSFAVYGDIANEDLFVLTKGIYVACMIKHIELPADFEKHITVIEMEEDEERAKMFNRQANTNLNIVLGGCHSKDIHFLEGLLTEGLSQLCIDADFIGYYEVESNV